MATAEITVLPIGREGASVGDVITDIRQRLEAQDRVAFRMGGMGTELEGDIEDILAICAQLHAVPLQSGFPRAYTVIKIDQRIDREQSLSDKIDSVERRL